MTANHKAEYLSDAKQRLLKSCLQGAATMSSPGSERIARRVTDEPVPLALSQEQVWRRSLRARDCPTIYNETVTVHRNGPLDVPVLRRCFAEILRRHEAWRTTFETVNNVPIQVIHAIPVSREIPYFDLQSCPAELGEAEATCLVSALAQEPFDLARGPLLRPFVLEMGTELYRFTLVAHQSIVDGFSAYQIFPAELAALYEAFSQGKVSPLPELPIQFSDFSIWQRGWLDEERVKKQQEYWETQLAGSSPTLDWPARADTSFQEAYRGAILPFAIPESLGQDVKELARSQSVTLFMVLLAGFVALLHSYAKQPDILVATLSPSGRKRVETQRLLGYFLNPVMLRFSRLGEISFRHLLLQARSVVSDVIAHDDVPMESLAAHLRLDTGRDPLVKFAITLQPRTPDLGSAWSVTTMDAQNAGSPWDLFLSFIERGSRLIGRAQYNPSIFEEKTIRATIQDLMTLLEQAVRDPGMKLGNLLQRSSQRSAAASINPLVPADNPCGVSNARNSESDLGKAN